MYKAKIEERLEALRIELAAAIIELNKADIAYTLAATSDSYIDVHRAEARFSKYVRIYNELVSKIEDLEELL